MKRSESVAILLVAAAAAYVCLDLARDPLSLGTHDWDAMESYRLLSVTSILRFHQFPFWDPYSCGGYTAWGAPEGGTNVVSPFLPVYLLLSLPVAIRIEIVAMLAIALTGTWALSGHFCREPLLRAGVCIVAVLNSRWALQVAAGHTWHLSYAILPWTLYALLRSDTQGRSLGWLFAAAASLAFMVYAGGIYPLPHTILVIVLYSASLARQRRDYHPLARAGGCVLLAFGLSAPKLLAVVDSMRMFPRAVSSREYLDPISYLLTFGATTKTRTAWPYWDLDYAYHEYGIYIGLAGLGAVVVGALFKPLREDTRHLRVAALGLLWLSLGLFGPWVLLHLVPPFRSQHVPTRFAYPGLLLLSTVAAANFAERIEAGRARGAFRRPHEIGVALAVLLIALDIVTESRSCLARGFGVHPPVAAPRDQYQQSFEVGDLSYREANQWASLGVHMAGVGSILCGTFHGYNIDAWKAAHGRPPRLGARGLGEPEYRGEVYLDGGTGSAELVEWSPNRMVVDIRGARPGDWLVLNQNFDPSWRANDRPTVDRGWVNAYHVFSPNERVTFVYRSRTFGVGIAIAVATVLILGVLELQMRRRSQLAPPIALERAALVGRDETGS